MPGEHSIDSSVLRCWLSGCRDIEPNGSLHYSLPDIRLIDAVKGLVTDVLSSPPSYAALSYVWGGAKNLMLTSETMAMLQTPGTLTDSNQDLPLTIRDAILTCQLLDLKYLWVDSLCLEQDSPSKRLAIRQMDALYGCAQLTIVAADGSDAENGLPGIRPHPQRRQRTVRVTERVTLAHTLPAFTSSVYWGTWNTRGWTYQERILSNRKLYFTADQAFYECPHGVNREDSLYHIHFLQQRLTNHEIYVRVVGQFTVRTLSYEQDVEAAFEGVSNFLSQRIFNSSPLLFGMPLCCIDAALLWVPSGQQERRRQPSGSPKHPFPHSPIFFPSWSWMGWKGGMFLVLGVGNLCERLISCVRWLDPKDDTAYMPEASTGIPPPAWADWPKWTRHTDKDSFGFYTSEDHILEDSGKTNQRFCHPVPSFQPQDATPLDRESGLLFMGAEVAKLTITSVHTDRRDIDSRCTNGDHGAATCQLWICEDGGVRAGIVHVPGAWFLKQDLDNTGRKPKSINDDDPSWDDATQSYMGTPGLPAINPQEARHPKVELFDQEVYSHNLSWCLYNVLVVELVDGIAYRMGIGKVHIHAL
ncbi:heterokaryon incompatibility protein-domain-containing protein [Podospora aff. communis PSN243]|uniref:Heterokaryon incompatibility protein-domain-containing protein n=1 Tax=Podospora aff. communis PSN243 TaxID=3040156 RepID=A0AAV9GKH4_9PEZI|nr:heterokaryon incompatibility protein-domain-containing protein [Podospora aff. communis PSN243]